MELRPSTPPGNAQRKARAFHAEIVRLRAEGYTHSAIHQALIDAGVNVSLATVKREAARVHRTGAGAGRKPVRSAPPGGSAVSTSAPPSASRTPVAVATGPQSGREFAESFAATVQTNPLLKRK